MNCHQENTPNNRYNWSALVSIAGCLIAIAALALSCSAREESGLSTGSPGLRKKHAGSLFPVCAGGKYGYIDRSGQVVFAPRFDEAESFAEDMAAVKLNGKWGFIDRTGEVAVPLKYDFVTPFSDGLALVGKYTDIGTTEWVRFIDRKDHVAISSENDCWDSATPFAEGFAVVMTDVKKPEDESKYGYIDRTGKLVNGLPYSTAHIFSDGLAGVGIGMKCGFIDTTQKVAIQPQFNMVGKFSEGLAAVYVESKWGYIDTKGAIIITPRFNRAMDFSEGLAGVEVDGKWGFIDKTGTVAVPLQFANVSDFSEGYAVVKKGLFSDYHYIDRRGEVVFGRDFKNADSFHDGLAKVRLPYGYIDKTGQHVWKSPE